MMYLDTSLKKKYVTVMRQLMNVNSLFKHAQHFRFSPCLGDLFYRRVWLVMSFQGVYVPLCIATAGETRVICGENQTHKLMLFILWNFEMLFSY